MLSTYHINQLQQLLNVWTLKQIEKYMLIYHSAKKSSNLLPIIFYYIHGKYELLEKKNVAHKVLSLDIN